MLFASPAGSGTALADPDKRTPQSRHVDINEQCVISIQHQTAVMITSHNGVERLTIRDIADRLFIEPSDGIIDLTAGRLVSLIL